MLLNKLNETVRLKQNKYKLIVGVLYHTYLDAKKPNQYEVSKILGVSDATVHNYTKMIESELRKLELGSMNDGLGFYKVLKIRVEAYLNDRVQA